MPFYRRKPGAPVECVQFFRSAIPAKAVEIRGRFYATGPDGIFRIPLQDGDWIVVPTETEGISVMNAAKFAEEYELVPSAISVGMNDALSNELDHPPRSIMEDPDDLQAQLGHKPK